MPAVKKATPGAPRNPDSRPGQLRALRKGQHLEITEVVTDLNALTATKQKLTATWQRAISLVVHQMLGRQYSTRTASALDQQGGIVVTMYVKRVV
jgi:hypothetical protein